MHLRQVHDLDIEVGNLEVNKDIVAGGWSFKAQRPPPWLGGLKVIDLVVVIATRGHLLDPIGVE